MKTQYSCPYCRHRYLLEKLPLRAPLFPCPQCGRLTISKDVRGCQELAAVQEEFQRPSKIGIFLRDYFSNFIVMLIVAGLIGFGAAFAAEKLNLNLDFDAVAIVFFAVVFLLYIILIIKQNGVIFKNWKKYVGYREWLWNRSRDRLLNEKYACYLRRNSIDILEKYVNRSIMYEVADQEVFAIMYEWINEAKRAGVCEFDDFDPNSILY